MFNLATMLELGDGVSKDPQEALRWYKESAKHENKEGQSSHDKLYARLHPPAGPQYQPATAKIKQAGASP